MLLMAIINRRSGIASGGVKLFQAQVAFAWKGIQSIRNYSGGAMAIGSEANKLVKTLTAGLAREYHNMETYKRNAWDQYAGTLGSAVDREAGDNVSNAKSIIPKRRRLMSGINAFVGTNINAFLAGLAAPFDMPPMGQSPPPPPLSVSATYSDGAVKVTWIDPVVGENLKAFVRIWARVGSRYSHIVAYVSLPSSGGVDVSDVRLGRNWVCPKVKLAELPKGTLVRIQLDTLVHRKANVSPVVGCGSNVTETKTS